MSLACSGGPVGRAAPGQDRPGPGSIAHCHPGAPSDCSCRPLCQVTPRCCPRASLRWPRTESRAPLEGAHLPSRTHLSLFEPQLWPLQVPGELGGGEAGVPCAVWLCQDQAVPKAGSSRGRLGQTPAERATQRPERAAGGRLRSSRGPELKDAGSQARVASEPCPGGTVCSGSVTAISRPVGAAQRPSRVGPGPRCVPAR